MSPNRFLSQQLADVALGLMAGVGRIWRAGAGPEPDSRPRTDERTRAPRRHHNHGTLLSADELRAYLSRLHLERLEAHATGLASSDTDYIADLADEIADCRSALVGAMVIELARRRAESVGRQTG